jgi:hypothetical protein
MAQDGMPERHRALLRAHAEYLARPLERAPLFFVVLMGAALSVLCLLHAMGKFVAERHLIESRVRYAELASPPVPDERNAAVFWRQAVANLKPSSQKVDPSDAAFGDWWNAGVYASGGAVRSHLAANLPALGHAEHAAQCTDCDWGLDCSHPLRLLDLEGVNLSTMGKLVRLAGLRARMAAFDGDWTKAARGLRTMTQAARDWRRVSVLMHCLTSLYWESQATEALQMALGAPGPLPGARDLQILLEWAREQLEDEARLSVIAGGEERFMLLACDLKANGDERMRALHEFDPEWRRIMHAPETLALPFEFYPLVYPWDRADSMGLVRELRETGVGLEAGKGIEGLAPQPEERPRVKHYLLPFGPDQFGGARGAGYSVLANRARWRLAFIALAIQRYRLMHQGNWPASLVETGTPAAYLEDPLDPERSSPRFEFPPEGKGYCRVWSVGWDGKDDGGDPAVGRDIVFYVSRRFAPAPNGEGPR